MVHNSSSVCIEHFFWCSAVAVWHRSRTELTTIRRQQARGAHNLSCLSAWALTVPGVVQTEYAIIEPPAKRARSDALTDHQRDVAERQRRGACPTASSLGITVEDKLIGCDM